MVTTVDNPAARPLDLEITVNGTASRCTVPASGSARCESPLAAQAGTSSDVALLFRGDRRLVLRETTFQ
jgi:hypothetical protein